MGFWMNPSQPTAKLVSRSPSAVMATIGHAAERRLAAKPERHLVAVEPGDVEVDEHEVGPLASARARTPSSPSVASMTSCPSAASSFRTRSRFLGSSSM